MIRKIYILSVLRKEVKMLNKNGQIEVCVGGTFCYNKKEYLAVRPKDCSICCFSNNKTYCLFVACLRNERKDLMGVHFIELNKEEHL